MTVCLALDPNQHQHVRDGRKIASMMRLSRRHRCRIALLAMMCLLLQQLALAAYACPLEQIPADTSAMAEHCAEMGMQPAQDNPALCAKHCAPDLSTAADHVTKLSVPALALPPLDFAPVLVVPVAHVVLNTDAPVTRTGPPPRLRFCSLLI